MWWSFDLSVFLNFRLALGIYPSSFWNIFLRFSAVNLTLSCCGDKQNWAVFYYVNKSGTYHFKTDIITHLMVDHWGYLFKCTTSVVRGTQFHLTWFISILCTKSQRVIDALVSFNKIRIRQKFQQNLLTKFTVGIFDNQLRFHWKR